ncbi:MAG: amidase, partial [Sphingomicrobium sp.]
PLALGSDTAGSVRNPASACGIVGWKPAYDALPRDGIFPLAWSLDHVGLLARHVDDMAIAAAVLGLPTTPAPITGLRIGFVRHWHEADMPATPDVAAALNHVASSLVRAGATVTGITLPHLEQFNLVNRLILQSEGFAIHASNLRDHPERFSKLTRAALLTGAFTTAETLLAAYRLQRQLTTAVERAFDEVDVLLTASSMTPPCRIDDPAEIARTYLMQARSPFNVTGHAALAMASGVSADGLPLSVQFAARTDATLFAAATAWEQAMGGPPTPSI